MSYLKKFDENPSLKIMVHNHYNYYLPTYVCDFPGKWVK